MSDNICINCNKNPKKYICGGCTNPICGGCTSGACSECIIETMVCKDCHKFVGSVHPKCKTHEHVNTTV